MPNKLAIIVKTDPTQKINIHLIISALFCVTSIRNLSLSAFTSERKDSIFNFTSEHNDSLSAFNSDFNLIISLINRA